MGAAPMFVTLARMKQSLRLSGVPDNAAFDASLILDDAIRGARVEFYRRLDIDRVQELIGFAHADEPTNLAQTYRACAELLEVKIVLLKLLPRLRNFIQEATGASEDAYNREALLRDLSGEGFTERIAELRSEIDSDFAFLEGDTPLGEEAPAAVVFESDETPARPGESVFQYATPEYQPGEIFLRKRESVW